jgi:hypothetical protein
MFALPSILLTICAIYIRPQELSKTLAAFPLLHVLLALTIFGVFLDFKLRLSRPQSTPLLPWSLAFMLWGIMTIVVKVPSASALTVIVGFLIPWVLFATIAHGVQTFRALATVGVVVLGLSLFVAFVGIDQQHAPTGCYQITAANTLIYDGRPCVTAGDCRIDSPEPGAEYACEHVGMLGTQSQKGRVRYKGILEDPNYLALVIAVGLPFAFALLERKKSTARLGLLVVSGVMIGLCTIYTQSRGGQLVFLSVLGTYFVQRMGWKGVLLGVVAAVPVLAMGGRSGDEAEGSSAERLECWLVATELFRESPLIGVGIDMFVEYHFLTAHNSYLLAAAETGIVGFFLWSIMLLLSVKIPIMVLLRARLGTVPRPGGAVAPVAKTYALAMLAAMIGMTVGIFFLSFTYHATLWIFFGLSGALYSCVKTHDPTFTVRVRVVEMLAVLIVDVMLIGLVYFYAVNKV